MIKPIEIGWIAGLLEGEGSFIVRPSTSKRKRYHIYTQAVSTDEDTINRLHLVTGIGKVNGSYLSKTGDKEYWSWYAGQRDAASLMMTLYPLMSTRRQSQIKYCLEKWRSFPYSWKKV